MRYVSIALALLGTGCAVSVRLDPALERITHAGSRVEVSGDAAASEKREILRRAEEVWKDFREIFGAEPPRVRIVLLARREAFERELGRLVPGARAVYLPGESPRIVTYVPVRGSVVRHELAHHFVQHAFGTVPSWINEGIAEALETAVRRKGRVEVPVFAPHHLDRLLRRSATAVDGEPLLSAARHGHVDYSASWARVALHLRRSEGSLREKLDRLRSASRPRPLAPPREALLWLARSWRNELATSLRAPDPNLRMTAARILGQIGEVRHLRNRLSRESDVEVRWTLAAALARAGDKEPLRRAFSLVRCGHSLRTISIALGREIACRHVLTAWLANPTQASRPAPTR